MSEGPDEQAARVRDAERLRQLEARLGEKVAREEQSRGEDHFRQANIAWRMVTELVAGLGIGFGIGYGLDVLFSTAPFLMVVFVMLGLAAGVKTMLRTARDIGKTPGRTGDDKGE
ncbi:MAG: AtpZ/AtpI family protein [Paracoccus sp. (in: a-proteobacteria)]|uniref:AtpZ/AtpI family protein n=1 Tax=Paracoccus sp. TaxID=267 RepID=UPI0039E2F375